MAEQKGFGIRHLQCALIFFGLAVSYALRVNMSVAIVAMTDKSAASEHGDEKIIQMIDCISLPMGRKNKINRSQQLFWGYVITQVPSGQLAQKYGGHLVLFWGLFCCSVFSLLTPIGAKLGGWPLVCALRLLQGLCQGSVFPSTHSLISKWAPIKERGKLGTISYSGSQLGTALMLCVSGEITSSFMGWPGIFYTSGGIGCIWGLLFYCFGSSSPSESRLISEEEKKFIEMLPVPSAETPHDPEEQSNQKMPTPWLQILTSVPFYCLLMAHATNTWGYYTLLTQIPTYLKSILGMDIKKNALSSSLPYWVMLVLSYFFLFISEVLRKTQCMSLSVSRKFFNTIGQWIPALGLIGMGYMGKENETLVMVLLMIIVGTNAAIYLGFQLNHIDLSPNFAGTLMGMTNCASNLMSILAPLAVGFIVSDEKNPEQWKIIFFITAGFFFIGNLMFICFGKTNTQYWNDPQPVIVKTLNNKSQHLVYQDTVH